MARPVDDEGSAADAMGKTAKRFAQNRLLPASSIAVMITFFGGNVAAGGQLQPPPNDGCTNAIVASTANFIHSTDTQLAIVEPSDPTPNCGNGSRNRSVWYRYMGSNNGTLSVDTLDSDYDTILSTYTGSCGSLQPVSEGCNDDDPFDGAQSRIELPISRGETFFFMVSDYQNEGGLLVFHLSFSEVTPRPTTTASPGPIATPTASSGPTETIPPASCQGDCDGSGGVTVDEIVTGVSIALGNSEVGECAALDLDASGSVTVDELLQAIQSALNGC